MSNDSSSAAAGTDPIRQARALVAGEKIEDAIKLLTDSINGESDRTKRAPRRMALGVMLFDQGRMADAEKQLSGAIEDGVRTEDYAHFYLGLIKLRTNRSAPARSEFEKVLSSSAPQATQLEARYHIAESHLQESAWRPALQQLEILRKKWRSNELYPTVLYGALRSEAHLGRKQAMCKTARELYSKYPTLPVIHDWNASLEKNSVDGLKLPCMANGNDLRMRVRRLQWGGESERALAEIKALGKLITSDDADGAVDPEASGDYGIDALLANNLINDGQTDEAMKILLKHYEAQKNRPGYLLLLAKAASRAGDYPSAVGAYQKAYDLAPRSKNSANALFQAAFTAYQMQDYDGASRRFEKFVQTFGGSKLARDSQWHLAWIRYLKSDYSGALESLKRLASAPKAVVRSKGRRTRKIVVKAESVSLDRVRYWTAMSYMRLGQTGEAIPLFQQLVRDPSIGYYAIASYYRLLSIPGAKLPAGVEARLGLRKPETNGAAPTEEEVAAASDAEQAAESEYASAASGDETSEEATADNDESSSDETEVAEGGEVAPGTFNDAVLSRYLERSRELSLVGLEDAARRELLEVERRVRTPNQRKLLMSEYQQVRNFFRSSYMGDVNFGGIRLKNGLRGEGKTFWEFAYPRAYENTVVESSKSTSVPQEFIWGIMRAESHFRHDAQSAVGALGLMQIMPFTGRQLASLMTWKNFDTQSLLIPETNIRLGSRYLQRLLEKFSGSVPLAAASYNAGPHRVHAWVRNFGALDMDEFIEHIPYIETRNYVKKVTRNFELYHLLYAGNSNTAAWLSKPVGVTVDEKIPTKEIW
jgi:soluble lytic murein transglycosylase